MEKLLIINPGSTSTKVAVFDGEEMLFKESLTHSREELAGFDKVVDQYEFRRDLVFKALEKHNFDMSQLSAVVSRGGLPARIETGAYEVNDDMIWQLKEKPMAEHAANVGPLIARAISDKYGIPSYIYDGISADEMTDINRISGIPEIERTGEGHNLNSRAAAIRYAEESGRKYSDITAIVAHMGGGTTINLHHKGRIVDVLNDNEGAFTPERSGSIPYHPLLKFLKGFEGSLGEAEKYIKKHSGMVAYLGTTDCIEIEKKALAGDEKAKLIYDCMLLNVAKCIGKLAPEVEGKVDAIVLTGGLAYSPYVAEYITKKVGFIAPVVVYGGENEMLSLAKGGLRVLRGEEKSKIFVKQA